MNNLVIKILFITFVLINVSYSEIINEINITGNKRIPESTIKVIGEIRIGSDYDDKKLNDIIKKLYNSLFFENVSLNLNNNILNIDLIENPIVEDIQIEGIKKDSLKEFLLENISLKKRSSFSDIILQKDLSLIKNILKSNGYYFVDVKTSINIDDNLNSCNIIIDIKQGSKAKIKNIKFIGDKKINNKKLYEIIASEEHKFWKIISKNVYLDQSRINLDKRLIQNYYRNLGFYRVDVLDTFAELDKEGNFNLIYNINAGDYYYFNNLILNLPQDYDIKDFEFILNYFDKIKGKKFSSDDLNKILYEIDLIAESRLYDFINSEIVEEIVDNNKINITFNVKDSTKFYVEKINIYGNYNTLEEVIRNELIVDEGDPLNELLFNKSINNIRGLNIFSNVKADIKEGSNQNLKEIDISIEEKPTGEISLAAGVGTSGTTIGGGIVEKNFLGKGINLNTNLELSDSSIKGQFIYTRPNFAYTDNDLTTRLFSNSVDNLTDFGYKVSELGFSLGTRYEQYQNLYFSPNLKLSSEDLKTNSTASKSLRNQEGTYRDMYFEYGLNYDLRNSRYRTTSGNITSFFQELPLISDSNELINTFSFTQFKKLSSSNDMVGKASIYLKSINSISKDNDVRISKRGKIPYSRLRGFENGKIGPIANNDYIGGNYVSALNLSTNLPFVLPSFEALEFSYFIDAANVWGVDFDSSVDDSNFIRTSTGVALDLLTPVGPLSFSLTQPITKKNTDRTESFRFNLGTTF